MAQDGAMPETKNKVLTVLKHKTKNWSDVRHSWQVRSLDYLQLAQGKILLDPNYPNLALIYAEWEIEEDQLERWFSLMQEDLDNVVIHFFPNVAPGLPEEKMFSIAAKVISEAEARKQKT